MHVGKTDEVQEAKNQFWKLFVVEDTIFDCPIPHSQHFGKLIASNAITPY